MEGTKVDAIIDQLDDLYGNRHERNTNINNFIPLLKSENEEATELSTKHKKNTVIVLSKYEYKDDNKG